jgi:hypothetical protein
VRVVMFYWGGGAAEASTTEFLPRDSMLVSVSPLPPASALLTVTHVLGAIQALVTLEMADGKKEMDE